MKLRRSSTPNFGMLLFVPLVDVAAALLFFFLLSGTFLLQPGIAVKVPASPFILAPQRDPLIASITGEPSPAVYFDNQKIDPADLASQLVSDSPGSRTLIIKADERAPVDLLVRVVNVAITRGFSVVLATSDQP